MIQNKRIYNCYYKECSGGIGDFLRGSVFLKMALDQFDINFDIDFTFHPISKFLSKPSVANYTTNDIFDIEKYASLNPSEYIPRLRDKTEELLNYDIKNLFLFTNFSDCLFLNPSELSKISITAEASNFFSSRLKFTKDVYETFNALNLPDRYNVAHFRCGDSHLVSKSKKGNINNQKYKIDYNDCLKKLENIDNPIILTDSNDLKDFFAKKGYKILHRKSQHSSINPGVLNNIQYKDELMLYVCLDMLILSRAQTIHTYSVYPWFSGFSFWTAKIHNIPIYNQKISHS